METIRTKSAPAPGGAYAQGVIAHGFLFTAGLGPIDPASGSVVGETIEEQTVQVMNNLEAILQAADRSFADVIRVVVHLQELHRDFLGFNRTYASFFGDHLPVRTTVGSQLMGILIEMDITAAMP